MAVKRVILQHFSMKYDYMTKERPNIYQPSRANHQTHANSGSTIKQHLRTVDDESKKRAAAASEAAVDAAPAASTQHRPDDDDSGVPSTNDVFADDDEYEEDYDQVQEFLRGHQRWDEFDDDDDDAEGALDEWSPAPPPMKSETETRATSDGGAAVASAGDAVAVADNHLISATNSFGSSGLGSDGGGGDEEHRANRRHRGHDDWSSDSIAQPDEDDDDADVDDDDEDDDDDNGADGDDDFAGRDFAQRAYLKQPHADPPTEAAVKAPLSSTPVQPLDSIIEMKEKLPDTYSCTNNMYKKNAIGGVGSSSNDHPQKQLHPTEPSVQAPRVVRSSPSMFKVPLRPSQPPPPQSSSSIENWRYRNNSGSNVGSSYVGRHYSSNSMYPQQQAAPPAGRFQRFNGGAQQHETMSMSCAAAANYGNNAVRRQQSAAIASQQWQQQSHHRYIKITTAAAASAASDQQRRNWRDECMNNTASRNCGMAAMAPPPQPQPPVKPAASRYASTAAAVQARRCRLDSDEAYAGVMGLSPPSESLLMQRRQRLNSRSSIELGGLAVTLAGATATAASG